MADREITPFSVNSESYSESSHFNEDSIPTLYLNKEMEDDEFSVWTTQTDEVDWNSENTYMSRAGLPTAIETSVDRSQIFKEQKEQLKPFELSTTANEHLLENLSDNDLIQTIVEIWVKTQLQNRNTRLSNLAWYNWVLLDMSRRIYEVYKRHNGDPLMMRLIETLASRVYYQPMSPNLTQDGKPFVHYPLFHAEKISRLIRLAAKFTDTVCAASEFIDFMFILNMTKDEFSVFYDQMMDSRALMYERLKVVRGPFHSENPLGPFKPTRFD